MKDDDDLKSDTAMLGFMIGIIGVCAVLLALVIGELYGWVVE